jgi:hypothetical protein
MLDVQNTNREQRVQRTVIRESLIVFVVADLLALLSTAFGRSFGRSLLSRRSLKKIGCQCTQDVHITRMTNLALLVVALILVRSFGSLVLAVDMHVVKLSTEILSIRLFCIVGVRRLHNILEMRS